MGICSSGLEIVLSSAKLSISTNKYNKLMSSRIYIS